jgi:hypothetical protein
MAARQLTLLLAYALVATACSTAPGPSANRPADIDFVRGCWVEKDGPGGQVHSFLRLLPPSPGDNALEGEIRPVASLYANLARRFTFKRDGSSATFTDLAADSATETFTRDTAVQVDGSNATYRSGDTVLHVSGDNEGLKIFTAKRDGSAETTHFAGERDGCD